MAVNKVIVQFQCGQATDLDRLFSIERTLEQAFTQHPCAVLDGHDIGEGKFNIFIHPRGPWAPVIERIEAFLRLRSALGEAVIAKYHGRRERFEVIWPPGFSGEFTL